MEDLRLTDDRVALGDAAKRAAAECPRDDLAQAARHIAECGLGAVLAPETAGGLALGVQEALVVCEAVGHQRVRFPVIETMVASAVAAAIDPPIAVRVVSGADVATVAWRGELEVSARNGGWRGSGRIVSVPMARGARWLVVAAREAAGSGDPGVAILDLESSNVVIEEETEYDHERPTWSVVAHAADLPAGRVSFADDAPLAFLRDIGDVLRAGEMLGSAEAAFSQACAHVATRRQFGRSIAANQAVRHRLARDHLALSGVRLNLRYAGLSTDRGLRAAPLARAVGAASARAITRSVVEHAIQLHGAMGFCWDVPLHQYLRRILQLSSYTDSIAARDMLFAQVVG